MYRILQEEGIKRRFSNGKLDRRIKAIIDRGQNVEEKWRGAVASDLFGDPGVDHLLGHAKNTDKFRDFETELFQVLEDEGITYTTDPSYHGVKMVQAEFSGFNVKFYSYFASNYFYTTIYDTRWRCPMYEGRAKEAVEKLIWIDHILPDLYPVVDKIISLYKRAKQSTKLNETFIRETIAEICDEFNLRYTVRTNKTKVQVWVTLASSYSLHLEIGERNAQECLDQLESTILNAKRFLETYGTDSWLCSTR